MYKCLVHMQTFRHHKRMLLVVQMRLCDYEGTLSIAVLQQQRCTFLYKIALSLRHQNVCTWLAHILSLC